MAKHIRPPTLPPTRIRAALANAASAGTVGAAESVTHHKADFNGKGYGDLAVGAEYKKVGTDLDGGAVAILQGSACNLPRGTTIAASAASSHDRRGAALTASDINGDGYPMFGASAAS